MQKPQNQRKSEVIVESPLLRIPQRTRVPLNPWQLAQQARCPESVHSRFGWFEGTERPSTTVADFHESDDFYNEIYNGNFHSG